MPRTAASPQAPRRAALVTLVTLVTLILASAALAACTPSRRRQGVEFLQAPPGGEVASLVSGEQQRAAREGRKLLVYVGATWCEPCQRFHKAAASGKLDAAFPGLRFMEFDADRDGERLASAGYVSRYIPLFARPDPSGRSSGRQVEGSVKGDGAVDAITPRLRQLLED